MTTPALARPPRRTLVIGPTTARRLGQGIADLARYRELLLALSVFRVRVRYKQSVLGIGWAVLQPAAPHARLHLLLRGSRCEKKPGA